MKKKPRKLKRALALLLTVGSVVMCVSMTTQTDDFNSIQDPDKFLNGQNGASSTTAPTPTAEPTPAPTSSPSPTPEPTPTPAPTPEPEPEVTPTQVTGIIIPNSAVDLSEPPLILPVTIDTDLETVEIRKTYELSWDDNPASIPLDSFEREGYMFSCTDVLRQEVSENDKKEHTETVTLDSQKNDTASVLSLLPETKEVETQDGYVGVLTLNTDSIKTEVAGYGSSSKAVTATRQYPNLNSADTSQIPKTVEDNGRTLQMADIQWQESLSEDLEGEGTISRYTATVTYSGTATSSYVKGYTVTADYIGEVSRTDTACIRYTVIFTGIEIPEPTPEPTPEPSSEPTPKPTPTPSSEPEPETGILESLPLYIYLIPLLVIALLAGTMIGKYKPKKKEKKQHEETQDDSSSDGGSDDADDEYIDYGL